MSLRYAPSTPRARLGSAGPSASSPSETRSPSALAPTPAPGRAAPRLERPSPARVFIVEDHPVVREAYLGLLADATDVEVAGAVATAEEAIEAVSEAHPDLLLVDISLPGMSGLDLLEALRAQGILVRALIVSGHERAVYGDRAAEAGAVGYVVKADGPMALLRAIRQALS